MTIARAFAFGSALLLVVLTAGCGTDVNLGGSTDAGTRADASFEPSAACEPCASAADCAASARCVELGGHLYCATSCADAGACGGGERCRSAVAATGESVASCIPDSNACASVASPPASDGGVLAECGDLVGPGVVADCKGCDYDCQRNGCYGGWWCNRTTRRCQRPPKTCG